MSLPMTVPRLPPLPDLDWKPDGTPVARAIDDIYFSVDDGLAETREIFLKACGLPERWQGRDQFTIAELGFGTGLNFLAAWDLWRSTRPSPHARLHFVSFEGFPLNKDQAAQALSKWPELKELADALIGRWPNRARGIRRIECSDGVSLTLHIDDVSDALPAARFSADAWFLDGFAPAKNESMWADDLYPHIARCSAPGARVGTYTAAGAVRRGLSASGFTVSKAPGHGRKRERLFAEYTYSNPQTDDPYGFNIVANAPKRIAIIGAGIGGASLAHAFSRRGADVTVFDKLGPGQGASGNPLALVMPRLDAEDNLTSRILIDAYLHAQSVYSGLPGVTGTTTEHRPPHDAERQRFRKVLADPPLPPEDLAAGPDGALQHKRSLIIEPEKLLPALLQSSRLIISEPSIDLEAATVEGEPFDAIILATGMALADMPETAWLPIEARLGQVEFSTGEDQQISAIARGDYAIALGNDRLWGATFESPPENTATLSDVARVKNLSAVRELVDPDWADFDGAQSRAGIRATTPGRFPFVGPVIRFDEAKETFAGVRHGRTPVGAPPTYENVWMLSGLGSRGFTFAPWLADGLAACLYGEPSLFSGPAQKAISPLRFLFSSLKRGRV
ncbi:MAG: tRNA (5-methylaminomethyl-2-thiouridine)(34)-methyltransferase MnmD [Pseudomonadota bacterium]